MDNNARHNPRSPSVFGAEQHISSGSARSPSWLGAIGGKHVRPICLARSVCRYLQPTGDRIYMVTQLPTESQLTIACTSNWTSNWTSTSNWTGLSSFVVYI